MPTVTYLLDASVKPLEASPSLPSGYALVTISEADLGAFTDVLHGVQETITGDTLTERLRKLRTRLNAVLAGASGYSGPTDVHANNSDISDGGAWIPSYEVVVHPRGEDMQGEPSVCAAQDSSEKWYAAYVHAKEV